MALNISAGGMAELAASVSNTDFTVAGFVKLNSSTRHFVFNFVEDAGSFIFGGAFVGSSGTPWTGRVRASSGDQANVSYSEAVVEGQWVPFTVTWDESAHTVAIKVNGGAEETATNTSATNVVYDKLAYGFVRDSGGNVTDGDFNLAYTRSWKRKLTAQEITDWHNAASAADVNAISTTSIFEGHDFVGDANSDTGGTAATLSGGATVDSETPFSASLSIDDVGGDNAAYPTEAVTANVTGDLEATPGTVTLEDTGGNEVVSQTVITWDDGDGSSGSVDFTVVQGGLPFRTDHVLTITTDSAVSATITMELEDQPDHAHVDVVDPVTDDTSIFFQVQSGTPATGQQIEYTDAGNTTVNADGTFSQTTPRDFNARVWDTDYTWGSWTLITVNEANGSPDDSSTSQIAGSLLPTQGASRFGSSLSVGPLDQPFKLSARGLPTVVQAVKVTFETIADEVTQAAFRLPEHATGTRVYAVVSAAFDDSTSNELRVVNGQSTVASGLDFSSTGRKEPTTLNLPSTSDSQATLSVQWQVADTDATQGEAHVYLEYIFEAE